MLPNMYISRKLCVFHGVLFVEFFCFFLSCVSREISMIRSSKVLSYVMSSLSTFSALSVNKKHSVSTRVLLAACATMFLLIMLWLATGIVYTTAH